MHQFRIANRCYADTQILEDTDALDTSRTRVSDLVELHGTKLRMEYEYDFGDSWLHTVDLEKVVESEPGSKYPRCLDGACACPPEDVGGVYGFADFVEAITDPGHSEYADYLDWHGPFDPAEFDAAKATRRMRKGVPAS